MRPIGVATLIFLLSSMASPSDMGREEAAVRTAYAKLSFAVDLNTTFRAVRENPEIDANELAKRIETNGLRFQLSDFKVGDLADVLDSKYTDIAGQYPDGQDIINESTGTENFDDATVGNVSMDVATAEWGPGPSGRAPDMTVRELLPTMEQESGIGPLRRYCSFTVTVTLKHRSRTYKASFLFGDNGRIAPGDVVSGIGGGSLRHFITHSAYPHILLKTALWKRPAVRSFLIQTQRVEASCSNQGSDVCCDLEMLRCGVAQAELGRQP